MATHSSILAWRTPWTEEPGGLQTRLDSSRLCSLTDLCPLLSLMLSSGSEGTTNLPAPSSVASRLLSPLVHSGHFFKTMLLFLGGGGGLPVCFQPPFHCGPLPLSSLPKSGTEIVPAVRRRLQSLKLQLCTIYTPAGKRFFCAAVYLVVVATA